LVVFLPSCLVANLRRIVGTLLFHGSFVQLVLPLCDGLL
jgi:hypothetical protein